MPQLHFEDFTPGRTFEHGPRRLPHDEMIAFAAEFDPQPMHLDEDAARETMLGGLAASGWHVCCILMRMCVKIKSRGGRTFVKAADIKVTGQ
ncbi:acyl dehydratase [Rhodoplanes sp. Z2-YC6860]|nr:acyl dehydratase [Rhodoplanes sp. Z2-YC6860]